MWLSQSNKLNMYGNVSSYCNDKSDVINTVPKFAESVTKFLSVVGRIKVKEKEKHSSTTGKTDIKNTAEEDLVNLTVIVASGLFVYARQNKNIEMMKISDTSYWKLMKLKNADLVTKCSEIYDAAKPVETELADFGVTNSQVDTLKILIDNFEISLGERDASVSVRMGAGSSLTELFNEADDILEDEMDKFADPFKTKDPEFYEGYYAARNIKNLGIRHEKKDEEPIKEPG